MVSHEETSLKEFGGNLDIDGLRLIFYGSTVCIELLETDINSQGTDLYMFKNGKSDYIIEISKLLALI